MLCIYLLKLNKKMPYTLNMLVLHICSSISIELFSLIYY